MDCSVGGEGPAILQLRKWGPSQFQFKPSEFREAFISPSRELLLLLSYQCEALLFPLITGDFIDCNIVENCYDDSLQDPCSSALSRSDSKDNPPSTSGSVMEFDNGFSLERNFSRSNNYPFVCDVNSLAWGVCGDTYNQHKDTSFRELLFVSGDQSVTVHAFCHSSDTSSTTRAAMGDNFGQGRWVEWGPSSSLVHNVEVEEPSSVSSEAPGYVADEYVTNGNREISHSVYKEAGDNESLRGVGSRRWLRSFFTKAETIKSDGDFWTRFPEKTSFPGSAKVVSFTIFNSNLPHLDVPAYGNSVPVKENRQESVLDLKKDLPTNSHLASSSLNFQSDVLPHFLGIGNNVSFKCTRVFSRNSHDLVGFFLTLVDPLSVNFDDENERNRSKNIIVVSRLSSWGIQWVSAVKLEESLNRDSMFEWADFCFSNDLLVCLGSCGLIFLYAAMSGNYVAKLDVLGACGLNPCSNVQEQEKLFVDADIQNKQVDEVRSMSTYQHSLSGGRMFRRLIVASYTSLLAVVDEYGVTYVLCTGEHILEKYNASVKLLPHSSLGMLVGWEAGGSDIGHQRVHSNFSGFCSHAFDISSGTHGDTSFSGNVGSNILNKWKDRKFCGKGGQNDIRLSGFSAASKINDQSFQDSKVKLHFLRKIFLPIDGYGEDDCICFSPLGITRLIKKHHIKELKSAKIVHFDLHTDSSVQDDSFLNPGSEMIFLQGRKEIPVGEAVGCTFQGCFYLVTEGGLFVVLPAVSVSSNFLPIETIGYRQPYVNTNTGSQGKSNLEMEQSKQPWSPWKVEILDRVLVYEGPEEADRLCLENGWDLKISRMRRLQMTLEYMKFDEIKLSLEMLVDVNLVEDGILRLLFAAVYLMSHTNGNDNEASMASRLLAVATSFVTKMIRKYGLEQHKNDACSVQGFTGNGILSLPPILPDEEHNEMENSKTLYEMAHFLEIIRSLQCRLSAKYKKPGQGLEDGEEALSLVDPNLPQDEPQLSIVSADAALLDTENQNELQFTLSTPVSSDAEKLSLLPKDSLNSKALLEPEDSGEASALVPQGAALRRKVLPLENPKEMIARWKLNKLDLKNVVRDALLSGRLPLAVLQLHLHRSTEFATEEDHHDTFTEVRDIGRAIAYDLFLKGEIGLAVATLQRLGEDIEICLKELVFGAVRRSVRMQIAEEMRRYGYLGPYEWKILERVSLLERLYPSSSFWRTFLGRQRELVRDTSTLNSPGEIYLHLLDLPSSNSLIIECGEVDGVVLGSWTNVNESSSEPVVDEDNAHIGYWAAAAVWSNAWDQRTIDRIVLDQPFLMGVHVLWESQLEYHMCHNDWEEVFKLLDVIPTSVLSDGSLQIALDGLQTASTAGCDSELPDYGNYICSIEELDGVCMDVPGIKIFRLSTNILCSMWLRMLMEQELAKKFIFLKEYWEGTAEIITLLARSGFITSINEIASEDDTIETLSDLNLPNIVGRSPIDTIQALHRLLVHYCAEHNLPNLLDLYLDHHKLVLDSDSLCSLQEAAGDCHWARWLLLSRIKGHEYDASFANARSIMLHNLVAGSNLNVPEIDDIIRTVDDIAEGGGEMAALATLMYAPAPIQNCLCSGSIRHSSSSAQCTLENLRPTLQRFPTLWRTLVAACLGEDTACNFLGPKAKNALSDYLNWRDNIFFSSGRDTSLSQILPCRFPKAVRRLIQLYVQGPLGWQALSGLPTESLLFRDIEFLADGDTEVSAISWEATIQKHVEEELYDSSLQETGLGLEHLLHRGRALAAFNQLLGVRVEKLKSEGRSNSAHGQANVQSDVQTLLAPILKSEESLLSSVLPLAISHFEDSVLVASCAFLLELSGLSASMLRVDIAALRRISSFYKSSEQGESYKQLSPKGSAFHALPLEGDITESLAQALADEYLHDNSATKAKQKGSPNSDTSARPSRSLMLVLQHLEKASLPLMLEGKTCGSWLSTGNGDGTELRSQQKAASQHWNLVTVFCQIHQLPLSTKYLAVLARDNDWVGFLYEAQVGGYPFETVVQVASKEFSDPRLKIHILTVLKSLQSRKKASSSLYSDATERSESSFLDENLYIPVELFRILADCEKQKNPGEALLIKAKDLSWSVLAMIASCFPDVTPLSCLTVWLEITAARETSSIKVNDIASQIADNVAAAVEATNAVSVGDRVLTFHYNRQNAKRRRLMEPISADTLGTLSDVSILHPSARIVVPEVATGEKGKMEVSEHITVQSNSIEGPVSLSNMVAVLCEQQLFLPLLRAFEMFLPSCSLLPFIRALQAFSQMRLSEASAHLGSFSARIKDEPTQLRENIGKEGQNGTTWVSSTAVKAADAMLSTCPSPYEKRCLLQLLAATDFGDGGSAANYYRRLYWKINLAEPSLRKDNDLHLGNETLDDASLLTALEKNGHWEQARNWAKQLDASGGPWRSTVHHVTETQAESLVAEWKEFLWDVPEERVALWGHCQTLFIRYSFPPLQAGLFFLKHAERLEKDLPARELHEMLLLSLQWLSGLITQCNPVSPLHLLREIETRVWLLAVESESQVKNEGDFSLTSSSREHTSNIVDQTANLITKMDNHINTMRNRTIEKYDARENNQGHFKSQLLDASSSTTVGGNTKTKRRAKGYVPSRRQLLDSLVKSTDPEDGSGPLNSRNDLQLQDESSTLEMSFPKWEERVGPAELERAVLSLLEFGQIMAAKQLQHKLSPAHIPSEFILMDAALKLAAISTPSIEVSVSSLDEEALSVIQSYNILTVEHLINPLQVLESLATHIAEGCGRGLCKRIIAVVKAANVLGLQFSEAFGKKPVELLQLLSLKAQESFEEAHLLVQTHSMPAASIAQILAESFLKGLLAAHRGGYMDSQKEEGPAPLLWRFSDFLKWAELCPSEPEIGHALMRLVITGQEIPHACEVELLILSHHFYKSSACLDGVDVLVSLAATRVEAYVSEGDFPCLARLITGVGNFHALNFILGILIENGQLELLLQKYSAAADANTGTAEAVRGFRMAVLTALKHFNPNDLDAFAMVYNHFDMKHETAALLESRAEQSCQQWFYRVDKDQNEDLLESMRYFIEAAEVHSSIDAGNKTRRACGQASLLSLQIRMPDSKWLNLSETNARRQLVEQSRFQEALIVAEAYGLNQPGEWALVLWNQMLNPELTEEFVAEFVAVLPLQPSMLLELAKFYRAEVAARGDQSQFSVWLTGGAFPAEWAKYLSRSFRCLLKRTRDVRLRLQLATVATGFSDVINACLKALDRVPENAGPLVLRRGHGGAYLPLM